MDIELNVKETAAVYAALLAQEDSIYDWIDSSTNQAEIEDLRKILAVLHGIIDKFNAPCPE